MAVSGYVPASATQATLSGRCSRACSVAEHEAFRSARSFRGGDIRPKVRRHKVDRAASIQRPPSPILAQSHAGIIYGAARLTCRRVAWVVRPDLPFDGGHFLGFAGALLAGWAALFELGGPGIASLKGETLSEKVHPRIFQILFVPGTFVLLCSVLL